MQTKILIQIEDTVEAPCEFEAGELDYTLKPALNDYIDRFGQKGIDKIRDFMLYTIDHIQQSYDNKNS